jgi:hypothetical protein
LKCSPGARENSTVRELDVTFAFVSISNRVVTRIKELTGVFDVSSVFRDLQRPTINNKATIREGFTIRKARYCGSVDGHVEVNQALARIDIDPVFGDTAVHRSDEPISFAFICRDEQEIVDQPQQEAVLGPQEGKALPFQISIKVIAKNRRQYGSLRNAVFLPEVLLAKLDEVLPDM